ETPRCGGGDLGSHTEGPPLRRGLKDLTAALSRENEAGPGGGPRFHVVLRKPPSGGRLIRRDPPRSESANRTPGPQRRTGRANVKRAAATAALFFSSGAQTCDRPRNEKADRDQRGHGLDAHRQLCP